MKKTMIVRIVMSHTEEEFAMEIGNQEPVLNIKKRIGEFLKISTSSLTLFVSCWELLDGLDMEDYPIIVNGTKIHLYQEQVLSPAKTKINVTVKFPSKHFTVEIDGTETVGSLKEKIHNMETTPIQKKRMQLYFNGIELGDDFRNVEEYGIGESSEIVVFLKSVNRGKDIARVKKVCFLVQTSSSLLNSAKIAVEMRDCLTICEMREELQSMKKLPRDEYIFVHKQRIMREKCSLRWHGVQNGDTLFVFKGSITPGPY